ncbi:zonular occludens toxin domain-containing protein [Photobacterium damselae]|uniref:zonular occludens toxin domain-containing protein n=2 Tax=Photobacterium damselae TaxID=38293 RepID=UPI002543F5E6
MINLIMGRPGGGKSYEAVVYHVLPAIQSGRMVITNLPINLDVVSSVLGEDKAKLIKVINSDFHSYGDKSRPFSKPDDYKDDWRSPEGQAPLVIVDEAHMICGRDATKDLLEFYSMHRHFGLDILLLTQSDRKLHRDVRDMIEIVYRCIKNTALGSDKTYTKKVLMGLRGEVVNTEQRKYEKAYFKFYQSHTASNTAVKEATASDVKPFWKSKLVLALIVAVLCSVAGIVNLVMSDNPLGTKVYDDKSSSKQKPNVVTSSAPVPAVASVPVEQPAKSLLSFFPFLSDAKKAYITAFNVNRVDGRNQLDLLFKVMSDRERYYVPNSTLASLDVKVEIINECLVKLERNHEFVYVTCPPVVDTKEKDKTVGDVLTGSFKPELAKL